MAAVQMHRRAVTESLRKAGTRRRWCGTTTGMRNVDGAAMDMGKILHGCYDVVVVGGGIIGMATAVEVQQRYPAKTVAVVEKEPAVAGHQSSHNSGVIHAGMYYEPGSEMARCCVEGADLMYAYAEKHDIPYERVGKLIVATTRTEDAQVQMLYNRGVANGVKDLAVLDADEIRALEPNVVGTSALHSPNTGIIDFGEVTRSLQREFEAAGGVMRLGFETRGFANTRNGGVEIAGSEPRQPGPSKYIRARHVITCAGLHMDTVAQQCGGARDPKVLTFRGMYYQMKPEFRNVVKRNVYPVPGGGGIPVGVHFTPTVNRDRGAHMIIGPGACICFAKEGYEWTSVDLRHIWHYIMTNMGFLRFAASNFDLSVKELYRDASKRAFLDQARKLVPCVTDDMVEPSFAGVMAQVFMPDGGAAKDFMFDRKMLSGTTLCLRNAPTPAATSSLALARRLVDTAAEDFEWGVPATSAASA